MHHPQRKHPCHASRSCFGGRRAHDPRQNCPSVLALLCFSQASEGMDSRFSDLTGLSPSSITLSGYGLEGMLDRTKTSGPSKRVIFLPIFISCDALASGWLAEGWELWQNSTMAFTRDFFCPFQTLIFLGRGRQWPTTRKLSCSQKNCGAL